MDNNKLITLKEAEKKFKYTSSAINRWILKGFIKSIRIKQTHYVDENELAEYIEKNNLHKPFKQHKPVVKPARESVENEKVEKTVNQDEYSEFLVKLKQLKDDCDKYFFTKTLTPYEYSLLLKKVNVIEEYVKILSQELDFKNQKEEK